MLFVKPNIPFFEKGMFFNISQTIFKQFANIREVCLGHDRERRYAMSKLMETQRKIEKGVVSAYQSIEDAVVGGYKKIEDCAVSGYKKIENKFVEAFTLADEENMKRGNENCE